MKIALSWSSGKDSAWSLHVLRESYGGSSVACLLTTATGPFARVSLHGVRLGVARAQAAAAGLPLRVVSVPFPCSHDDYAARMAEAVAALVADGYTHCAFGDVHLEGVRAYREQRLRGTGLEPLFPLWQTAGAGEASKALVRSMLAGGLRTTLVCVDSRKLSSERFAGRELDEELLAELPEGVDWAGENGEFHTCCWAGPMFSSPLALRKGGTVLREGFAYTDVTLDEDDAEGPANDAETQAEDV
eukprot:m51a1_g7258 hypothetical protein (245) ;mRNA; f:173876-174930